MSQYVRYPNNNSILQFPNFGAFPALALNGTYALDLSTYILYVFETGTGWIATASPTALIPMDVGVINGQPKSANAAVINSNHLYMQTFDTTFPGVVTASGGGTTNFLRADGTWAVPVDTGITQLTGDVTAGPGSGSQVATLATVNGSPGSFGSASISLSATVNAKGLITALSSQSIQITEAQVTNLVSDLAAKQSTTLTSAHILVGNGSNVATDVAMSGDISISNTGATSYSGTVPINKGGTGQTTANAAFAALSPQTTNGDLITRAAGVPARLAVGTNGQVLTVVSGLPAWAAAGVLTVSSISSNTSVVSGTTYLCDTSGAAFTVTLPTPTSGAIIFLKDKTGSFQTNNLTVAQSAAEKIEGLAASKLLQTNWGAWGFFSDGTDWYMGPF